MKYGISWTLLSLLFFSIESWGTINVSATGASNSITSGATLRYYYSNINSSGTLTGGAGCSKTVNPNCRDPTDTLTVNVNANVTGIGSTARLYVYASSTALTTSSTIALSGAGILGTSGVYTNGTAISFTPIPFTSFCNILGDALCNTTDNTLLYVYIFMDGNNDGSYVPGTTGDEVVSFTLTFLSNITANSTDSGDPNSSVGLYQMTPWPGDKKIHIRSVSESSGFPMVTSGGTTTEIQKVRYYFQQFSTTLPSQAEVDAIVVGSPLSVDANVDANGNLDNRYIRNLTNDVYYCVKTALIDVAGNIGYLVPNATPSNNCVLPSQVAGLMSESGHCFIATAAFGSPLAAEVDTLRKFRDTFLIPHPWGRKFVSWYYENSPPWAEKIKNHEISRKITRTFLWPLVGFSKLALKFGEHNAAIKKKSGPP